MQGYIYETTNLVNNKKYIGKKVSKIFLGTKYLGSGTLLKKAIEKYGKINFTVRLLECCDTKQDLTLREMFWIKFYNAVESSDYYNLSYGNEGNCIIAGSKHSEDWKRKISKSNRGKIRTVQQRKAISKTLKSQKRHWINNGIIELNVELENIDNYLKNDFKLGRLSMTSSQKEKCSNSHIKFINSLSNEERMKLYARHQRKVSNKTKQKLSSVLKR